MCFNYFLVYNVVIEVFFVFRLVNSVLKEELKTIHAFSQKTFTPEQWKEQTN